jgi:hypothetical protein
MVYLRLILIRAVSPTRRVAGYRENAAIVAAFLAYRCTRANWDPTRGAGRRSDGEPRRLTMRNSGSTRQMLDWQSRGACRNRHHKIAARKRVRTCWCGSPMRYPR